MIDIDNVNLRRLDMTLLLVFAALLRHRKATEVAKRLGLTQSAISHNLKRLREVFGDELFMRQPHGLEPTGRALALESKVTSILALSAEALDLGAAFDPASARRTVRIAALDYEEVMFAAPLIEHLRRTAPGVQLAFRPLARRAALDAMSDGSVDLALGYFVNPPPAFHVHDIYEERYSVVMAKQHPLTSGRLTPKRYAAADHLLVSLSGDFSGIVDQELAKIGLQRSVVAALPLFLPALATVARTQLVCTVPARLAAQFARPYGLAVVQPPIDIRPFNVQLVWHHRSHTEPGLQWLNQQLIDLIGRLTSSNRG
jgi:DNA-binding transcriptional LysR family regulator